MDLKRAIMKAHPVSEALVFDLSTQHWQPRILSDSQLPYCLRRIPSYKLLFAMASGDLLEPIEYQLDGIDVEVVGGFDSYRYDLKDKKPINKNNFLIISNDFRQDIDAPFLSLGPFIPTKDHRSADIPPHIFYTPYLIT